MGKQTKICVNTVTCPQCQIEIYSRAQHDYRSCYCGRTTVDGGFDYAKYGFPVGRKPKIRKRYIYATREELYKDWSQRGDIFGIIVGKGAN